MASVAIIDYGIGNVQSVVSACLRVGGNAFIARDKDDLEKPDLTHIILPGVGAIGVAMENLQERGIVEALAQTVCVGGVPFLGICVGMQILCETGEEFGECKTLGWIPGRVRSLASEGEKVRLPHVGWNTVDVVGSDPLFAGVASEHFYFVHSYALECPDEYVVATTTYHRSFISAVRKANIVGTQFHPEKSSAAGERLLKNFLGLSTNA